jgi:hypothetical protein
MGGDQACGAELDLKPPPNPLGRAAFCAGDHCAVAPRMRARMGIRIMATPSVAVPAVFATTSSASVRILTTDREQKRSGARDSAGGLAYPRYSRARMGKESSSLHREPGLATGSTPHEARVMPIDWKKRLDLHSIGCKFLIQSNLRLATAMRVSTDREQARAPAPQLWLVPLQRCLISPTLFLSLISTSLVRPAPPAAAS